MRCFRRTARSVRLHAIVLCALVVAACGGPPPTAGAITEIFNVESRMNGDVASAGEVIEPGALLSTDRTGVMEFELSTARIACRLSQAAEARVPQSGTPPLRYTHGTAVCRVVGELDDELVLEAGANVLKVERSVFRVQFDPDGHQRIAVLRGAVQVGTRSTANDASEQPQPDNTEQPQLDADDSQPDTQQFMLRAGEQVWIDEDDGTVRHVQLDLEAWTRDEINAAEQYVNDLQQDEVFDGTEEPTTTPDASESVPTSGSEGSAGGSEPADDTPTTEAPEVPGASDEPRAPDDEDQPGDEQADEPAADASDAAGP